MTKEEKKLRDLCLIDNIKHLIKTDQYVLRDIKYGRIRNSEGRKKVITVTLKTKEK